MSAPNTDAAPTPPGAALTETDISDPRLLATVGIKGYLQLALTRLRSGDVGSLPVIIGLIIIVVVFQSLNSTFLNAFNLVNLASQVASLGIIAMGVVLVLMLGEIDLSVGAVSGVGASVLLVMNVRYEHSVFVSVVAAIAIGAAIGLIQGTIFAKIGVPSFIVTLAGLLVWQGVQLRILASEGTINLPPTGALLDVGQFRFLNHTVAIVIAAVLPLIYLAAQLFTRRRRNAADLPALPIWLPLGVTVMLIVLLELVVYKLYTDRGVPWIFVIMVAIVIVFDWILRRTRYGRMIFAVGGNVEAARRSGTNVDMVRISVFVIASTLAAVGGVVASMRLGFANQQSGSGDVLINAIAAAVIGGTSLFGGRTRLYAALLGALVIGSIANGLELLNLTSAARYIVTGSVLLFAVVIDAVVQRRAGRVRR